MLKHSVLGIAHFNYSSYLCSRKIELTMATTRATIPTEMKVLMNHIYELNKGIRQMALFTCNKKYGQLAVKRLESQGIPYVLQPAGQQNLNVYFGRRECLEAIRLIVTRPLNQLTPEEDFILGAMLGYDICVQCERYCKRKSQGKCYPQHLSPGYWQAAGCNPD